MAEKQETPIVTHDIVYVNSRMGIGKKPFTGRYARRHFIEGYCGPFPNRGEAKPHVVATGGRGYADAVAVIGPPEVLEKVRAFVAELANPTAAAVEPPDGDTPVPDETKPTTGQEPPAGDATPADDGDLVSAGVPETEDAETADSAGGDGEVGNRENESESTAGLGADSGSEPAGDSDASQQEPESTSVDSVPADLSYPGYHDLRRVLAEVREEFDYLEFTGGDTSKDALRTAYREAVARDLIKP